MTSQERDIVNELFVANRIGVIVQSCDSYIHCTIVMQSVRDTTVAYDLH